MNKLIKKKWCDSLRSEEYKQGTGLLRDHQNRFCCLGVLCDIYIKETGKLEWTNLHENFFLSPDKKIIIGNSALPPDQIKKWAGFSDLKWHSGEILANVETLVILNDRGDSFKEIADVIEKYL